MAEYPYPLNASVDIFVTVELSRQTYAVWREQMLDLLRNYDMVVLIEGEQDVANESWLRSANLVLRWIYETSTPQTIELFKQWEPNIPNIKHLWRKLEDAYGSPKGGSTSGEGDQYPYPSHVSATSFVTMKLSGQDAYAAWREQMKALLVSYDMVHFIKGGPDGGINKSWLRSDALVRGWILATLSPQTLKWVLRSNPNLAAKDVWCKLEDAYNPATVPTAPGRAKYPYPCDVSVQMFVTVKLEGCENYVVWSGQMLDLLATHSIVDFVISEPPPQILKNESWTRTDALVRSWIDDTVTRIVLERWENWTTKEIWCFLQNHYGPAAEDHWPEHPTIDAEYPYPSHVSVASFVTVKLTGRDTYFKWRAQMKGLIDSHGMLGFIAYEPPDYKKSKSWRKSDELVKAWICSTLSPQMHKWVLQSEVNDQSLILTASDIWIKLLEVYGPFDVRKQAACYGGDIKATIRRKEMRRLFNIEGGAVSFGIMWQAAAPEGEDKQDRDKRGNLYKAILSEDFAEIHKICHGQKDGLADQITVNGDTALHVAVGTSNNKEFLKQMFNLATKGDYNLELKNSDGSTVLHVAAIAGNTEAAEILIETDKRLLLEEDNEGKVPISGDLSNMHIDTYNYLWSHYANTEAPDKKVLYWYGSDLLVNMISSKEYGSALRLFLKHSEGFIENVDTLLMAIAQNFSHKLNIWEKFLSKGMKNSKAAKRKEEYDNCKDLLTNICSKLNEMVHSKFHHYGYTDAILEAIRLNSYEFVTIMVSELPNAIWIRNQDGHNLIQYAVINRSEKVYNLVYQMGQHQKTYKIIKDQFGNNLLHLAARLAPANKLTPISGAALQIQSELQWFKEVKTFVYPACAKQRNWDAETPEMLFTREHKELVTEAEVWMKETAQSYTITAALIITIVFAAAITVPGGNKQDSGIPVFSNKVALNVFAISDAISLFTSVTSLLMFLSILTARFSEQDFLYNLPTKLIIGLATLFISTTAMLVAFGATLFLMFGHNSLLTLVPIAALTAPPVISFLRLQFPLIYDLIRATYFNRMFGKKSNKPFY